jgi:hypothetical protein
LQDFVRAAALPVYIKIEELGPGAGDPLVRIELAVRRIDLQRRKRTAPAASFVLLDDDQVERDPKRANLARRIAADNAVTIVWQRPCFEAVLLRHLPNRATHRPPDTQGAQRALEREWPDYQKPMQRAELAKRLDLAAVLRAAAVEPELAVLLRTLGLL